MDREIIKSSKNAFSGRIFDVNVHTVDTIAGESTREIVNHNGGAAIIALDADNNIYLVRQYRIAYDEFIYEIPAGKIDPGENPENTAIRELEEECGLIAKDIELLHLMYPSPGYINEKVYIYLTKNPSEGIQNLDPGESIEIIRLPLLEAQDMVKQGKINDAKSVIGILLAVENTREE